MRRFVEGRDVFVSFPTGGGKSLCYSVLPLVFDNLRKTAGQSLVIVVSPLIALMKDQVRALAERNVRAVYVEGESEFGAVCDGKYQLMFLSPETLLRSLEVREMLLNAVFQNNLVAESVAGFVVPLQSTQPILRVQYPVPRRARHSTSSNYAFEFQMAGVPQFVRTVDS